MFASYMAQKSVTKLSGVIVARLQSSLLTMICCMRVMSEAVHCVWLMVNMSSTLTGDAAAPPPPDATAVVVLPPISFMAK